MAFPGKAKCPSRASSGVLLIILASIFLVPPVRALEIESNYKNCIAISLGTTHSSVAKILHPPERALLSYQSYTLLDPSQEAHESRTPILTDLLFNPKYLTCPPNEPEHLFHQTIQNPSLPPPSPTDFLLEWDALQHIPSRTLPQTLLLLKHLAEDHTSAPVRFAVFVVPHKPSNADRRAIQNAAHAIGLWAVRVYTASQAARFSSCVSQRAERGLNEVVFRSRWSDVGPECRGEVELEGVDRAMLGAAVVASMLEPEVYFDLQALPLPYTVVDRTISWVGLGGQKNMVIQRNQPVPARKNVVLTTAIDDQRRAIIPIIQGQAEEASMNDEVVVLKLDCIPSLSRGTARIKVTVDVTEDPDANKRILKATAHVIGSDASCTDEVFAVLRDYNSSTELSQAELDAEIRYMEERDVDPRGICTRTRSPVEYDHLVPFEDSV